MKAAVVFYYENHSYYSVLEEKEQLTIGSDKYDKIRIQDFCPHQIVLTNQGQIYMDGKPPYSVSGYVLPVNQVVKLNKKHGMMIYLSDHIGMERSIVQLPYEGVVTLGRSTDSNIIVGIPYVSRRHMEFYCKDGRVYVCDKGSSNGTYVNGRLVKETQLKDGDVISVHTFRITYMNDRLSFENADGLVKVSPVLKNNDKEDRKEMKTGVLFQRSPRLQNVLPQDPIVLASPPNRGPQFQQSRSMFLSLLSTGTMFATSMLMGAASPVFMAARAASLIMPLANMGYQKNMDKKRREQLEQYEQLRKDLYGQYIRDQKRRIQMTADEQRRILQEENPSIDICISMVEKRKSTLFERTGTDRDFLHVRMGMGYEELCVPVKANISENGFQMEQDEMRQLATEIIEETKYVDYIPARLYLNQFYTVGMIGYRQKVLNQIRNMIISLCATHFYEDVKIVGIFDEEEKEFWSSLRWLPHVWDNEKQSRFLAFNKKEADVLCERMHELLEERKRNLSDKGYIEKGSPLPHYIFLLGSRRYVQDKVMMPNLLMNRPDMGISTIFLFDSHYNLPKECQFIVDMDGEYASAYERDKVNHKFLFTPDKPVTDVDFDRFTRTMSAIRVDGFTQKADIPNTLTFLEGYGVRTVEQLEIEKRWRHLPGKMNLAAPVGMMSGGRVFALDGYDSSKNPDSHGAHGLVAGTTGSGKSEFLQSWILAMAVNYPPNLVNFALIDYKGGGMSQDFRGLPHLVGEATDISAGIDRALEAFRSENEKREIIFNKYQVKDWQEYFEKHQKGLIPETVPQLFIIVDEFAELKTERAECIKDFISIARIGRSLGVHLLLATQTPSGSVTDEIRNNSNFKICLKMQNGGESRSVIGTTDAARIRNAGRAYVKVGEDGFYGMFQSFWCGAPYYGDKKEKSKNINRVRIVETDGTRLRVIQSEKNEKKSDIKEIQAVVKHIKKTADKLAFPKMKELWMPELEGEILLHSMRNQKGFYQGQWKESEKWLRFPIGKYDSPATQSQGTQYLDFAQGGHLAIYGAPQTGKTTFLKTILYSAGLHFRPDELVMYGIDCGTGTLKAFEQLPHVGGIVKVTEADKLNKLQKIIESELVRRKAELEKYHLTNLADYRQTVKQDIPAVLFLIDNLPVLIEYYEKMGDWLASLVHEAMAYGIYVIFTANSGNAVKFKIKQSIKNVAAFELIDKGEYSGFFGSMRGKTLPNRQGRVYMKEGDQPRLVQLALPVEGCNELERSEKLLEVMEQLDHCWYGKRPEEIPYMPTVVHVEQLSREYKEKENLPIGISYETMKTVKTNMSEENCFTVYGCAGTGKSRFLESMTGLLKNQDNQVYVIDGLKRSLADCENFVDGYCMVSEADKVRDIIFQIQEEVFNRRKARKSAKKDTDYNNQDFTKSFPQIALIIDDWNHFMTETEDEIYEPMLDIIEMGKGLGVFLFLAGRTTELLHLYDSLDEMTRIAMENQKAMVISGSLSMCSHLKTNRTNEERTRELVEGEAWFLENGNCMKIKPLG